MIGTLTFTEGQTLPLESFNYVRDLEWIYLRVKAPISELGIFENENATQVLRCDCDGEQMTFRGFTKVIDIVPEDGLIRVGLRRKYV